ncbi:DUF1206 domain-containing protein [Nocardioides bizhenqiangii]|uniref:DUF1206 domain-containing protein n=1 Tax=Nocardioides bizhenqiangii TaxID=3095076 RepID=A0ABZ0ZLA7_9ACTN|nr:MULTISPECIES: DUF1206 domain-containing protein [unclassified Nocardioides]MDZ5620207.1 DUF1206 domain-containing protein [Nocardioides sp. HM23]WQQ24584.1 DUF1206 domain-containing protein [Nocardioides sp. HM61]
MAEQATTRDPGGGAEQKARDARDHPALSWMARIGFAMYGVVYVVVGVLAVTLAVGDSAGEVSGQGALHELAQKPLGSVALVVVALGLIAVTVWELCEAVGGHNDHDGARRLASRAGSVGRAIIFGALAFLSIQIVLGGSSGGGSTDGYTAQVMQLPFGPALVVAVGLAIVAFGLFSVYKGLSDRWRKELETKANVGDVGTALTILARTGFTARGLAFCLIGGLFIWAGFTHEAQKSAGLDQALHRLRDASYGPVLLCGIAVGLAAYGLFNIAKAWALREN